MFFIRLCLFYFVVLYSSSSFAFSQEQCYSFNTSLNNVFSIYSARFPAISTDSSGKKITTFFNGCLYSYSFEYYVVLVNGIWDYDFIPDGSPSHSYKFINNKDAPSFDDQYYYCPEYFVGGVLAPCNAITKLAKVSYSGHIELRNLSIVSDTPIIAQSSIDPVNNVLDSFLLKAHNSNVEYGSYLVSGLVSATMSSSFDYNLHNHIISNSEMISLISAISSSAISYYPGLRSPPVNLFSDSSSLLPINFSNSVYTPPSAGLSSGGSGIGITSAGSFFPLGANLSTSTDGGGWTYFGNSSFDFLPAYSDFNPEPFVITGLNGLVGSPLSSSVISLTKSGNFVALTFFPDCCFVSTISYFVPVTIYDGSVSSLSVYISRAYSSSSSYVILKTLVSVADTFTNGRSSISLDSFKAISLSSSGVSGVGAVLGVFDARALKPAVAPVSPSSSPGGGGGVGGGVGGVGGGAAGCVKDCATETTQLSNSGFLSRLSSYFSAPATASTLPDSKTGADVKGAGLNKTSVSFSQLLGFRLPAHSSVCPVSSFEWSGSTYVFDAHCKLATDNFDVLRATMTAMFSLSALFVVLKA